jgi:hypothetical protein
MKRSTGARIGATLAVSALSLALITGCSSEGSDDAKDTKESAAASSDPAAKALSSAELEKLLLATGDIKGYKVESGDDTLPKSKDEVKTDKAECAPLAWSMAALAPGDTDASAGNTVTAEPDASAASKDPSELSESDFENAFDVSVTFVGLSSYDGDGAEKALKAVSGGVTACSGGYAMTGDGETTKVTKVTKETGNGGGDESVAYSTDVDMNGDGTATFHTEVVRTGNSVATFYTLDLAALGSGGKASAIPAEVVTAQVGKLK